MSPGCRPALAAGEPATTGRLRSSLPSRSRSQRRRLVGVLRQTPTYGCSTFLPAMIVFATCDVRVAGGREADAGAVAGARLNLVVEAEHLAAGVEQRAAGVAGVDRRVGLDRARDRVVVRRGDAAADGTDDARRWSSRAGRTGCRSRRPDRRPEPRSSSRTRSDAARRRCTLTLITADVGRRVGAEHLGRGA